MTNPDFTTVAQANRIAVVTVPAPDLRANVAAAQAAGDLAYAQAEAAGLSSPDLSDAYHTTFAQAMRASGTPIPCACDFCNPQAYNPTDADLDELADWLCEMANGQAR